GPALMGGYEYSPEETNKRPDQSLASKHNESMLLLPRLFYEAGYEVTVLTSCKSTTQTRFIAESILDYPFRNFMVSS
ncbi:MAG TPA: hypothetical protein VJ869_09725, partial [Sphaerochaeta sp.]|nr:hypothetical protein [Sphaerochaeta sp.]